MIRRSPSQIVGQEQHIATYVMLTQESTKSTQAPTHPPRACVGASADASEAMRPDVILRRRRGLSDVQ